MIANAPATFASAAGPRAGGDPGVHARTGSGELDCALVDGASVALRVAAHAPLKLLVPVARGPAVRACLATFGGGLLAGDRIALRVRVRAGATVVLGTQSAGKIYRSADGRTADQELAAEIGDGATLAVLPDALTCFAGARYHQDQSFALHANGSLLLLDWLTAGRVARGERWAFAAYRSRNRVTIAGRPHWLDALRLDGGADLARRCGRFQVLANVLLAGPRLAGAARALLAVVAGRPADLRASLLVSASARGDGALLRFAGTAHAAVERALRDLLAPAFAAVGGDPWLRRN